MNQVSLYLLFHHIILSNLLKSSVTESNGATAPSVDYGSVSACSTEAPDAADTDSQTLRRNDALSSRGN